MKAKQINVLLVEDNADDAKLVQMALAKAAGKFNVHWTELLSEALALMANHQFDVALVDLSLSDACGLDSVLRIRLRDSKMPIVLLTGNDSDETANKALDNGAQDYLVKDRLFDSARTEILERSIGYAIHRQQHSETQHRLAKREASHRLLKIKNRRLAKVCKTAEQFVENVSHEFRTPLTVIKEYTSLMVGGLLGPINTEQAEYLNVIENRADDLNRMVDDILDSSRLDAGLLVMSRTSCQITDIIDQVRPTLMRKAASRGKQLEFAVDPDLPTAYCDPEKVGRVIVNLVVNAIKFCGDPGHVKLWARPDSSGKNLVISVTDDGRGLAPEHLQAVFGRFKQVGNRSRQSANGFGLGLSIAKELVDLSFGQLTVESELQKGCTFTFTLPVADALEIVSRCVERRAHRVRGEFSVSLLSAVAAVEEGTSVGDDIHFLLNDLLRTNDLLFRVDSGHWLVVLAANSKGVDAFRARVMAMLLAVNRNRPRGALPAITFANEGSWQLPDEASQLRAECSRLMKPEEIVEV